MNPFAPDPTPHQVSATNRHATDRFAGRLTLDAREPPAPAALSSLTPNLVFPAADEAVRERVSRQGQRGPKPGEFEWTATAVATLTELRAAGVSQTEIGEVLGITRSAVAAKISRLGLPLPANKQQTSASVRRIVRHPRVQTAGYRPEGRLYFEDLTPDVCHFPVGKALPYLFCGADTAIEPYCADCAALARAIPRAAA